MSKIVLVTGKNGLVGSSIYEYCCNNNIYNFIFVGRENGDLSKYNEVKEIFDEFRPSKVIHTAAMVGGVGAHTGKHALFLEQNCLINLNILKACKSYNVKTLLALSSVAAFPHNCHFLKEEYFKLDTPHEAEFGYSLSKILLDNHIQLLRQEYNLNYCAITPVNIYGPNDNFNLKTGHLIASLTRKTFEAKTNNTDLEIWGDGLSLRQFIYSKDLASILIKLLNISDLPERLLIANPKTYNISNIVDILIKIADYKGNIKYNIAKPSGLRARECDVTRLKNLIGLPTTNLEDGLKFTYDWFLGHYSQAKL